MAAQNVSPGGALLRASRVFAVPKALRPPKVSRNSSPTSTIPYPIHQSITTPRTSIPRGDWGFKRPLPLKSTTKSGTPLIRVKSIDSYEDITDFESAGDHTITLRKWQELNLPLTTPVIEKNKTSLLTTDYRRSVFEDDVDKTVVDKDTPMGHEDLRWKFGGPYLASLDEGAFANYVEKEVKGKGPEFRKFVRKSCAEALTREARQEAATQAALSESDEQIEAKTLDPVKPEDVTEEQITQYIRKLRGDRATLNQHIRVFLDLPPAPTKTSDHKIIDFMGQDEPKEEEDNGFAPSISPFAETGPPKTHPSAGLSYLRSSNFIPNHPLFGPRECKDPVEARIVMPKNAHNIGGKPMIGVGGFIADVPKGVNASAFSVTAGPARRKGEKSKPTIAGLLNIEPDKVGGSKAYVHPKHAHVDPNGRVIMEVDPGDEIAVAVKLERTDQFLSEAEVSKDSETQIGIHRSVLLGRREAPRPEPKQWNAKANGRGAEGYGLSGPGAFRQLGRQPVKSDPAADKSELAFLNSLP